MKTVPILALIATLAGCSPGKPSKRAAEAGNSAEASAPASYDVFPAEVRAEIYRWDLLNQKCSGQFRKREAACEGADTLAQQLLTKGWCHGGADDPANAHWVLCAQDYPGGEGWVSGPGAEVVTDQ